MEKVLKIKLYWVGLANSSAPSLVVARALNSPMCLTPVNMLLCLLWPARIVGSLCPPWPIRGGHCVRLTNQRPGTGTGNSPSPGENNTDTRSSQAGPGLGGHCPQLQVSGLKSAAQIFLWHQSATEHIGMMYFGLTLKLDTRINLWMKCEKTNFRVWHEASLFQSYTTSEGRIPANNKASGIRMPASSVTEHLSELDTLLADLSSAAQQRQQQQQQDYYSDSVDYSKQSYPARWEGAGRLSRETVSLSRPPPPKSYANKSPKTSKKAAASPSPVSASPVPAIAARIPRRRPPKLMHVLKVIYIFNLNIFWKSKYCDRMVRCTTCVRRPGRITTWRPRWEMSHSLQAWIVLLKVDLEAEDYDYSFGAPSMSNYSTLGTLDTR